MSAAQPPKPPTTARCPACGVRKPVAEFHRDRSRSTGRKAHCKPCSLERVAAPKPKPGALVLVMPPRPAPPEDGAAAGWELPGEASPSAPPPTAHGHYRQAAERFIGALVPAAGDADALLCVQLRGLAEQADVIGYGTLNPAQALSTLNQAMIRVQRELAATRAAKRAAGAPETAAPVRGKFEAFRDAL